MISGYFRIKASAKGFLSLIAQVIFYSVIADVLCVFVFHEPLSKGDILSTFFPVTNASYWFVGTYAFLYIISPFLNRFLDSISKKQFVVFLVTLTVLVCYGGGCMSLHGSHYGDRSILTFIYFYSIGWFVKVYDEDLKTSKITGYITKNPWAIYALLTVIFFILVSFLPEMCSRGINFFFHAYNTIGLVAFSFLFFYCFKSLSLQKKWINYLAKSTFAIYLIHGNSIVTYHRWIYTPFTRFGVGIESIHIRLLYLLGSAVIVCLACILIDQVRQLLFKYVGIDWSINKINDFITKKSIGFNQ